MYLKTFEEMQKSSVFFMLRPVNAVYGFIITVCVSIAVLMAWAFFAPMDDVVKGTVLLRPSEAVSSVKCVTSGQIFSKNFENDDVVKEGDLLFTLDTSVYESELEACTKELERNQNDISVNETLLKTIETKAIPKLPENSPEFVKSAAYINELKRYETSVEDSRNRYLREENAPEMLKIPQNIVDLQNQLRQEELSFETWKNSRHLQALENQKSLQAERNSLESKITELERAVKNSVIRAPVGGRIAEITKLNIGDYLLAGEEVLRIIPQNGHNLKAEIYVSPDYIARIKTGSRVEIKFPGLPPSRYGMAETQVSIVPPDVTYVNGEPVFVVEAVIENPCLTTKRGQTAKLIPGITAEARIVTDRSTVMQMVMRKLDFVN